jgi:hypothetical protein
MYAVYWIDQNEGISNRVSGMTGQSGTFLTIDKNKFILNLLRQIS